MRRRKAARLTGFDYSTPGAYFVTICAHGGRTIFAETRSGKLELNTSGRAVESCWVEIPVHFDSVELDAFVVMPNHVHGVVVLTAASGPALPTIVGSFKSAASRAISLIRRGASRGPVWQRGYYERVVRSDAELEAIREYVIGNPAVWCVDPRARRTSLSASAPWL
jgi:REP element-mobilizing transposase RayT